MRPVHSWLWPTAILALVLGPDAALATGPLPPHDDRATEYGFSLQGGRADTVWRMDGSTVDSEIQTTGILIRQRFSDIVHLGMLGGYTTLTQTNNPNTAGLKPTGYYAGVLIDVDILTRQHVSVFGGVGYTYSRVEQSENSQSVELTWGEWRARLGGSVGAGPFRLFGGVSYGTVDGTERLTGTISQTTRFENDSSGGGFLGVDLRVDKNGYVGLEGRSGLDDGWLLYFRHRF
jgi:opacity protein-like surface antigen